MCWTSSRWWVSISVGDVAPSLASSSLDLDVDTLSLVAEPRDLVTRTGGLVPDRGTRGGGLRCCSSDDDVVC